MSGYFRIFLAGILLAAPAFAQKPLDPVRVDIATEMEIETPEEKDFHKLFSAELNKIRSVVFTSKECDFIIFLSVLSVESLGGCEGFIAATLIVDRRTGRHRQALYAGGSLQDIAEQAAKKAGRLFIKDRRR